MQMAKDTQDNTEYVILFKGAKLSKRQANKVGFGLIVGFVGALVSVGIFGHDNRLAALAVASVFALIGYFGLGNWLVKKQ